MCGNSDHWGRWHTHWTLLLTSWLRTVQVTQWNAGFHFRLVGMEQESEETGCWVLRKGLHVFLSLCTNPVYLPFSPSVIQIERWSIFLVVSSLVSGRATESLQNSKSHALVTKSDYLSCLSPLWDKEGRVFPFNILEECISVPSSYLNHTSYFSLLWAIYSLSKF